MDPGSIKFLQQLMNRQLALCYIEVGLIKSSTICWMLKICITTSLSLRCQLC